jgi:hypothetical protein
MPRGGLTALFGADAGNDQATDHRGNWIFI